jgi:deoxyadenosine/deoxycytidine kinase
MVGTGRRRSRLPCRALRIADGARERRRENPWLESFYGGEAEMRTYALHLQLHFLATRFASMRRMRGLGGELDSRPHLV